MKRTLLYFGGALILSICWCILVLFVFFPKTKNTHYSLDKEQRAKAIDKGCRLGYKISPNSEVFERNMLREWCLKDGEYLTVFYKEEDAFSKLMKTACMRYLTSQLIVFDNYPEYRASLKSQIACEFFTGLVLAGQLNIGK